jgi:translation initiation factor 2B subunit (eIF-2B alpha/beta/delta family)
MESLHSRIAQNAADRGSGASSLVLAALAVLKDARATDEPVRPLAAALLQAQPSMAPIWNAIRAALVAGSPAEFERYVQRPHRAPAAVVRHAAGLLRPDRSDSPLNLVTISASGTVLLALQALASPGLHVACAEGRPGLEGRRLAERLAAAGTAVTCYTDAALGQALAGADAVLVGADAVTPDWFFNKSGTRMLAAAAQQQGVPVYVLATRDKFLSRRVAEHLTVREESPAEVWAAPPPGVTVLNRNFEPTPLELVSAVVSDAGVLGAALVADACPVDGDDVLIEVAARPT